MTSPGYCSENKMPPLNKEHLYWLLLTKDQLTSLLMYSELCVQLFIKRMICFRLICFTIISYYKSFVVITFVCSSIFIQGPKGLYPASAIRELLK